MPSVNLPADGTNYSVYELLAAKLHAADANAHVPNFPSGGNIQADPANMGDVKYDVVYSSAAPMTSTSYGGILSPGDSLPLTAQNERGKRLSNYVFRNDSGAIQALNIMVDES